MAATYDDDEKRKKAYLAVHEVTSQIEKHIQLHGYQPSVELVKRMPGDYLPGFIAAHVLKPDFWDVYRGKVIRMAGYVAAVACFFAERSGSFLSAQENYPPVVDVPQWLMAMGVVRSACMVSDDDKKAGIPCNRKNFPISRYVKRDIVGTLAEIVAALMTDDPEVSE
jgi:hypothetical protein